MGANDPRGVANLDPRVMVGRIYVGNLMGLIVSEKKIFNFFFIISPNKLMTPPGCGQFGPQGLDWQDLCSGPLHIATY